MGGARASQHWGWQGGATAGTRHTLAGLRRSLASRQYHAYPMPNVICENAMGSKLWNALR